MDLTEVVLENTTHRGQLLAIVAELDYVPPALEKQDAKIAGLEHKLTQLEIKIASLAMQTKKEQAAEHEALHDSTTQRSATTVTGKYKVKANKEREYAEALEKEKYHKQQHATLSTTLEEARAVRAELASKLECYNKAQQDLALYRDIFDGPTTAYLGDDYLEYQVQQAQTRCDEIQDADSKVAADALAHAWGALDAFQWSVFDNVSGEHGNISPLRGDTAHEPLAEPDNTGRHHPPATTGRCQP
ncbi:hypothetical protein K438DRAFT_1589818 [Mycena galopus ATCC 62051]|nr:hypothetical protein K438DRAFT_1589818 [Mycena galopus ATCC 62051]